MKDDMPAAAKYWPHYAVDKYREVEAHSRDGNNIPLGAPTPHDIRKMATEAAENEIKLMKEAGK